MTKVICSRSFRSRWRTDQRCSSKLFSAKARKVSGKEISRRCLKHWRKSRSVGGISKPQEMTANRGRPEKAYGKYEYYKNGGADEIIFIFKGGGTLESIFGKQRYRAEDYIVIPRGITYRLVPDKVEEEDYLVLESSGPVR